MYGFHRPVLTGDNQLQMTRAGLGLNWRGAWSIQANAEVAFPVGHTDE